MGYIGDFGNSSPDWNKHPENKKIKISELKPGQKIKLIRLKLLHEPDVGSMTIGYAWLEVDGIMYSAIDLFGGEGMQWNIRKYRSQMYSWAKENIPKGIYIQNLFDRIVWACS